KREEPAPDAAFDRKQFTALVNERKLLHVINDSALLKEAYSQVLAHLYQPRSAKRAINRLRLLLFVAHARRAFGGTPALTPSHIGRWVAFQERWPAVAGLMVGNPPLRNAGSTMGAYIARSCMSCWILWSMASRFFGSSSTACSRKRPSMSG